jgi:hypothetical protein
MSHEHVHSIRQHKEGVSKFLALYMTNQDYRWKEEQLGWYVEIKMFLKKGWTADLDSIVSSLMSYSPSLAEPEEIKAWVTSVLNGTWKPAEGDLPEQYKGL